jgi:SET domain
MTVASFQNADKHIHCCIDHCLRHSAWTLSVGHRAVHNIVVQIQHSRAPNVQLQMSGGSVFKRIKTLQVVATSKVAAGEQLSLDYAPGKLESQVRWLMRGTLYCA